MSDPRSKHPFFDGFAPLLEGQQVAFMRELRPCGRMRYQAIMAAIEQGERPRVFCPDDRNAPAPSTLVYTLAGRVAWRLSKVEHEGKDWILRLNVLGVVSLVEFRFALYLLSNDHRRPANFLALIPDADAWF